MHCTNCGLHYIDPIPNEEDLLKMYPPSYQDGIDPTLAKDPYKKLIGLRYSYGYQFDLIKRHKIKGEFLDYGCGAANFLINAKSAELLFDGAEFNHKHVEVLREKLPGNRFFTIEELNQNQKKYDLIRISNVFEHFTQPKQEFETLIKLLKPGGYLLVEGPIEMNFTLAKLFRQLYFRIRKNINKAFIANHTPTHIVFTNRQNQKDFFLEQGLQLLHWNISEAEWPFPSTFESAKGLVGKINFLIARLSMLLSKSNPRWGNTFIYLGQKEEYGS